MIYEILGNVIISSIWFNVSFYSSISSSIFGKPLNYYSNACRYLNATKQQNHQCRKDPGLPFAIKEAKYLMQNSCQEQFRYDRWNCSVETRGRRNIFKKVFHSAFDRALLYKCNPFLGISRNSFYSCVNSCSIDLFNSESVCWRINASMQLWSSTFTIDASITSNLGRMQW